VTEIQSGLATQASVDTIQSDTNDIQTRLPAALESGRIAAALDSDARVKLAAEQPDYAPLKAPELRGDLSLDEAVDLLVAALVGVTSQPSGTTEKFKFIDGVDAFTTTLDDSGNRTSVALAE
jgi:hypothetical protein